MNVDQVLLGEVLAAVERHVLDEVGEAELVGVLDDRPDVDDQPELGALVGRAFCADVVAQAVRQVADRDARIDRDRRRERDRHPRPGRGHRDLPLWHGCLLLRRAVAHTAATTMERTSANRTRAT